MECIQSSSWSTKYPSGLSIARFFCGLNFIRTENFTLLKNIGSVAKRGFVLVSSSVFLLHIVDVRTQLQQRLSAQVQNQLGTIFCTPSSAPGGSISKSRKKPQAEKQRKQQQHKGNEQPINMGRVQWGKGGRIIATSPSDFEML